MTWYHGGKQSIGLDIATAIKTYIAKEHYTTYIEPFCGMLGVYQHMVDLNCHFLAGDVNESVILMWKAVQKGWKPPRQCSYDCYMRLKNNPRSSKQKGYLGHACSFRGIYFNTFVPRNLSYTSDKLQAMRPTIEEIEFRAGDYTQFTRFKNCVIYCDPPYQIQAIYRDEYNRQRHFDHWAFYDWALRMADKGNYMFVSETAASLPIPRNRYKLLKKFGKERLYLLF